MFSFPFFFFGFNFMKKRMYIPFAIGHCRFLVLPEMGDRLFCDFFYLFFYVGIRVYTIYVCP